MYYKMTAPQSGPLGPLSMSTGAPLGEFGVNVPFLPTIGAVAGAYHGYKRNRSVSWAIGWSIIGSMFPLISGTIAVAQGFGKYKYER